MGKHEKDENVHTVVFSGHWDGVFAATTTRFASGVGGKATHNAPSDVLGYLGLEMTVAHG